MPDLVALVPAAGRGIRFGGGRPKQLTEVAGRPALAWTLARLLAAGVPAITVALPQDLLAEAPGGLFPDEDPRLRWVAGGVSRQESVARCLEASPGEPDDLVLVHDGARLAVAVEDVVATLEAVRGADGAVLGRPVRDTLKTVREGEVVSTVERADLFRAETPQVFRRAVFARALAAAHGDGFEGTDEASLVERLPGVRIRAVAARWPNPKLTEPGDLRLIAALLAGSRA